MDKQHGVHILTMESHSALKRKEILSPSPTWMTLEDIILSELSQSQMDTYDATTYLRYRKQSNSQKQVVGWWLPGVGEKEKRGIGKEFQLCKMRKLCRSFKQPCEYI